MLPQTGGLPTVQAQVIGNLPSHKRREGTLPSLPAFRRVEYNPSVFAPQRVKRSARWTESEMHQFEI